MEIYDDTELKKALIDFLRERKLEVISLSETIEYEYGYIPIIDIGINAIIRQD